MQPSHLYIMTNKKNGTLYIGSTVDLVKRIWEHKTKIIIGGFTARYSLNKLVYYEEHADILSAGEQEKCYKVWRREWKIALINKHNPKWLDLYDEICL